MNDLDMKINTLLMEEMGFEEGDRKRIIDQDTGTQYQLKGKDIVSPGSQAGKQAIEFDPINNAKMMNYLFGEFVEKLEDEDSIPPVVSYCSIPDGKNKIKARIMMEDNKVLESNSYKNETVAYADLILRLNGEDSVDLEEYDVDRKRIPVTITPPTTQKKGSKKK